MDIIVHKAGSRGYFNHGWLVTNHSFSFAAWYNPEKMNFGALRVLNDDFVAPDSGFGRHPHQNMEIISIALEGTLTHEDSEGNRDTIGKGDVQVMSAGTGIVHSEMNMSGTVTSNFLQLWIYPDEQDIKPAYAQKRFDLAERKNSFQVITGPRGSSAPLTIKQDAYLSMIDLDKGQTSEYKIHNPENGVYLFTIEGEIVLDGQILKKRNAAGITNAESIVITATDNSELLLIEVPMKDKNGQGY
jgi:redox-sensitive bicupin YhaK (pirin superfamily)